MGGGGGKCKKVYREVTKSQERDTAELEMTDTVCKTHNES